MITFKLEDKDAQAIISVLNATAGHASFLDVLNEQFDAQFVPAAPIVEAAPVVEEVVVVEEPIVNKKTKATKAVEGDM